MFYKNFKFSHLFILIFLFYLFITFIFSIYHFYNSKKGINDCMITYVKSKKEKGFIYINKKNKKFHIDVKNLTLNNNLEKIGKANGCLIYGDNYKYTFLYIQNSIYCSVVKILN